MVYLDKLIIFLLFNFSSANENNITVYWASLVAQMMKNSPAIQETWVHFLSKEDHLEKGKAAAVAAKSHQSCPTLCDPINGSPPGSPVPGTGDSPGKNTGVGFHFLLQCVKVKSESEVAQLYPTLSDPYFTNNDPEGYPECILI